MCGIAGALHTDGRTVERALLERMAARLVHRGPDGEGFFLEEGVGLAHRRLSIVDVEGGAQPMADAGERAVVTYNGETFNHLALRSELEGLGERFRNRSDTEAVVTGYAAWGEGVLARMEGQFALGIWDRERRRLVLARDPVGIKPLYWAFARRTLYFASELKALEAVMGELTLDPRALDLFLAYGYVPAPHAIFREVRKLLPGERLRLDMRPGAEPELERFGDPRELFEPGDGVRGYEDPEELAADLADAVEEQLMSDVPLGAFLSGGVDSTAVVQAMASRRARPLCFAIGFADDRTDVERARVAAEALGVELETRVVDRGELFERLPDLAAQFDEPIAGDSLLPTDAVCALARERVTVALSGDGGDELFGGYRRFLHHLNAEGASALRRGLEGGVGRAARALGMEGGSVRRLAARGLPAPMRYAHHHLRSSAGLRGELYADGFRELLGAPEDGAALACLYPRGGDSPESRRVEAVDFQSFLPEHVLTKVDRLSMRHSLEVRVPILSPRVIRRAYATAAEHKYLVRAGRAVEGKRILKEVLRRRLPELVDARKRGFDLPLARWVGAKEVDATREALLSPEAGEVFDRGRMERFLDGREARRGGKGFLVTLWMLGLWIGRRGRVGVG